MRFVFSILFICAVNAFTPLSYLSQLERQTKELYIRYNMGILPMKYNTTITKSGVDIITTRTSQGLTGKDLDKFFW